MAKRAEDDPRSTQTSPPCGCSPPSPRSSALVRSARSFLALLAAFALGAVVYSRLSNTYVHQNGLQLLWRNNFKFPTSSPVEQSGQLLLPNLTCSEAGRTCRRPMRADPDEATTGRNKPYCPEYFRWIHEDLKPWKESGISRKLVESVKAKAHFRLVVVDGRAYVQRYSKSFQTRDVFTLWGVVQLLRLHGGRLPDLDLMFECNDTPKIKADGYSPRLKGGPLPPPLFRYCGDETTVQIVFPDWSFWGWPETNIKPWEMLVEELKEGNKETMWSDREPYAFWRGNPHVSYARKDLLRCNPSHGHDWMARLFTQDWDKETKHGFKESNLARQCSYRYKIYIEGAAWSVSQKYILACDSPVLLVKPRYYDFFSRGLVPLRHYWPINHQHKCSSIHFAVNWGNNHTHKAQMIGKEGSSFIEKELAMGYVYDYMFHLLTEYARLLRYKPTVPAGAVEICAESMACDAHGLDRSFMLLSMVNRTSSSPGPSCTLPPAMDPYEKEMLRTAMAGPIELVEGWEKRTPAPRS